MAGGLTRGSNTRILSSRRQNGCCLSSAITFYLVPLLFLSISAYLTSMSLTRMYTHDHYFDSPNPATKKGSRKRLIVYCECKLSSEYEFSSFAQGISRIPQLVQTIDTRVLFYTKGKGIETNSSCEAETEKLLPQYGTNRADPSVEVFISANFNTDCYQMRAITLRERPLSSNRGTWEGSGAHLQHIKRELQAITVIDWGEVFNQPNRACSGDSKTINVYRSKWLREERHRSCIVIHIPTIIRWAHAIQHRREYEAGIQNETVGSMLTHRMTYGEAKETLQNKTRFALLITLTTWKSMYSTDALVRHALCNLLSKKYKECERGRRFHGELNHQPKTWPDNTYIVQSDYKFVVSMPNELSDGYLVEKTIHPYLAGALAISASPGLGKYVNGNRPVLCSVPREPLDFIAQYNKGGNGFMPFNSTPLDWSRDPSIRPVPVDFNDDHGLLDFVTDQLEDALQPCIDEIIRLDQNVEHYILKLMEPFILNYENSLFDGTYVGISLLRWLSHAGSLVAYDLEDQIWNLAMPRQTVA
ncbi:hypothetical protein ACHAWF_002426 [Thalassiosira exigua]